MSQKIGSLNRSLSCSTNFQCQSSRISLLDLTPSLLPTFSSNSPRMNSDEPTQIILDTLSIFNNSDLETSDEFLDSEPSPSIFSKPPFQSLTSQLPNESSPAPPPKLMPLLFFPRCPATNLTQPAP